MRLSNSFASLALVVAALAVATHGAEPSPAAELKKARDVPVEYYVSLPKGWSADKTWPIVVALDGSGHKFPACFDNFKRARGERPFIVVVPCVSSNGKDPADCKAVIKIAEEVARDHAGRPKFFVTGFSAGGHVAWQLVFNHPELIAGAAPCASNFNERGIDEVSKSDTRIKLPIHGFNGGKDLPVINAQWDRAETFAKKHGYENLKHTTIETAGHSPFAAEVMEFFATLAKE